MIVVTGGCGFIGSWLCERLVTEGHEVVAVDNFSTGKKENVSHIKSKKFRILNHDITKKFGMENVDEIYHLASPASPVDYANLPIETLLVNSLGTRNMLEVARRRGARFLLASTSEVYGDPEVHPQSEDYNGNVNPVGPRACYDEGKRFAEALTMEYHRQHGLDVKIARIFNSYGPRMRRNDGRVIPNFITQALKGEPLTVHGDGSQTRSFCYVTDMVDGLVTMMEKADGKPVNVGNPVEISMKELAEKIIEMTGSESDIKFTELPEGDPQRRRPDIARAKNLGWQPRVGLEDGLEKTVSFFSPQFRKL